MHALGTEARIQAHHESKTRSQQWQNLRAKELTHTRDDALHVIGSHMLMHMHMHINMHINMHIIMHMHTHVNVNVHMHMHRHKRTT